MRRPARILTLVVTALLLSACGGSDAGGDDTTTVTVWDRAGSAANTRRAFFEEWNARQGAKLGLRVRYEPQATEKYEEIVRLGFQTRRAPDVFHAPSSQLGAFVKAGWVRPLEGAVDPAVLDAAGEYLQPNTELVWGGKPYAIPTTTFNIRLLYNKQLFQQAGLDPEKPPQTFSELRRAAEAITAAGGGQAFGIVLPVGWVGFQNWVVDPPLLATDADLAHGMFNARTRRFETERYAPVVELYRGLVADRLAYPGAATMDYDTEHAAFAEGKVGMMLQSSSSAAALKRLSSKVDVGLGPIPVPDGTRMVRSPMNAGFPYAISSTAKDPDAAAKVLEVLVGPEMQAALAAGGDPPLSEDAWSSPEAEQQPLLQQFHPTEQDQQWPKSPASVVEVQGATTTDVLTGLILESNRPVQPALKDLGQRYQEAFDRGVADDQIDPNEFTP